jgi:hypothetical protein
MKKLSALLMIFLAVCTPAWSQDSFPVLLFLNNTIGIPYPPNIANGAQYLVLGYANTPGTNGIFGLGHNLSLTGSSEWSIGYGTTQTGSATFNFGGQNSDGGFNNVWMIGRTITATAAGVCYIGASGVPLNVVVGAGNVNAQYGFVSSANNSSALVTITVTASPFTYSDTSTNNQTVFIMAGTISALTLNGSSILGITSVPMQIGESLVVTYSAAPAMKWKAL